MQFKGRLATSDHPRAAASALPSLPFRPLLETTPFWKTDTTQTTTAAMQRFGRGPASGPPVRAQKPKHAVSADQKAQPGRTLDLSIKPPSSRKASSRGRGSAKEGDDYEGNQDTDTQELLDKLPVSLKDFEELRKLDLSGQMRLGHDLGSLRFVGGTLTWLNLSGVDLGGDVPWAFLKMCTTLFGESQSLLTFSAAAPFPTDSPSGAVSPAVLNISHCNLEELPSDLAAVTSLKALVASHNQITSPSLSHLSSMAELNSLILSDNQLTSIPSSFTNLSALKKFSIANNKLSSVSLPDFSRFAVLEELRLNGNSDIKSIPDTIGHSQTLSLLELSNTGVASSDEVERLRYMTKLVNLGLKGTPLSESPKYREKVIKMLPRLRILDNVRFDAKFLERKEKAKSKDESEQEQKGPIKVMQRSDGKLDKSKKGRPLEKAPQEHDNAAAADAKDVSKHRLRKEKRKQSKGTRVEDVKKEGDGDKTKQKRKDLKEKQDGGLPDKRGKKRQREDDEAEASREPKERNESVEPSEESKKKRSRGTSKKEQAEAAIARQKERVAKTPKQIGGSLSAPAGTDESNEKRRKTAGTQDGDDDGKEGIEKVLKARSSVVGVIDVPKEIKKPNGGRVKRKDRLADAIQSQRTSEQDVLALLAQEKEKASVISGWD